MAVVAGIGDLPDTIEDRAVIISLRRKAPGETVAKFRIRRDKPRCGRPATSSPPWAPYAGAVGDAEPDMPPGLDDRAEDVWEALIAIADLAGGDWPARARKAATTLSGDGDGADSTLGERLLADLRDVFGDADVMRTETILAALHKISEAPWGDYYGHPLSPRDLAKLLRPYGVRSTDVKIDGAAWKGYRREHLHDPWDRYLPPAGGGSATSATSATAQVREVGEVAGRGYKRRPATGTMPLTRAVAEVAEVAEPPAARGQDTPGGDDEEPPDWL